MDLSVFFNDDRVKRFKTHIVMKSVGVESDQFKAMQTPIKRDEYGNPVVEIFPAKQREEMEAIGWELVLPTAEPTDAKVKPVKA
jgi:hypothetical protein